MPKPRRPLSPPLVAADAALRLRRLLPTLAGSRTRRARAMRLVEQVLNPLDAETAAIALTRLIGLLCDLSSPQARVETQFYCLLQATLHRREWEAIFRPAMADINARVARSRGERGEAVSEL